MNSSEKGFFDSLNRGPAMIRTIRDEVLHDQASAVHARTQIEAILIREGYDSALFTSGLFDESIELLELQKQSARLAQDVLKDDPKFLDRNLAFILQIDPAGITRVTTLPISVSVELEGATYTEFERRVQGSKTDGTLSAGMASPEWITGTLPVTVARQGRRTTKTPEHEDLHVQYRLLHPSHRPIDQGFGDPTHNIKEVMFEKIVENHDHTRYRKLVQETCKYWLQNYLNELSAGAITKRDDAYYCSFMDRNHVYFIGFQSALQRIRDRFPDDIASHLQLELIIHDEVERIAYRARMIQTAYQTFSNMYDEEDLVAICNFLTADQGYLVNAFRKREGLPWEDRRQLRQWRAEYEAGGRTSTSAREVVQILSQVAEIDVEPEKRTDPQLNPLVDELVDLQGYFNVRLEELTDFFDSLQYQAILSSLDLPDRHEWIREQVLLELTDFAGMCVSYYDYLFRTEAVEGVTPELLESMREEVVGRMVLYAGIGRNVFEKIKENESTDELFANSVEIPENVTCKISKIIAVGWDEPLLNDEALLKSDAHLIARIFRSKDGQIHRQKDKKTGIDISQWKTFSPAIRQLKDLINTQGQFGQDIRQAWISLLILSYKDKAPNMFRWWLKHNSIVSEIYS